MQYRLKSNFKCVWWHHSCSLLLTFAGVIAVVACFAEHVEPVGKLIAIILCALMMLALGNFGLVRCLLFEIRSIPIANIKRCWVCPVMIQYLRGWHTFRDFLVIDTAKTRKNTHHSRWVQQQKISLYYPSRLHGKPGRVAKPWHYGGEIIEWINTPGRECDRDCCYGHKFSFIAPFNDHA